MEQENQVKKSNNGLILIILGIILLTITILASTGVFNKEESSKEKTTPNTVENNNQVVEEPTEKEEEKNETPEEAPNITPEEFLTGDYLISTTPVIGSNIPSGYIFLKNGNFSYYNPSFDIRFTESEENRIVSFIGTWSIQNNKLVLKINKEEKAVGGEIEESPIGPLLRNYQKEIKDTTKTIEYTINGILSEEGISYLSLTLNNNKIEWYRLGGAGEYIETPKALAEKGYTEDYK